VKEGITSADLGGVARRSSTGSDELSDPFCGNDDQRHENLVQVILTPVGVGGRNNGNHKGRSGGLVIRFTSGSSASCVRPLHLIERPCVVAFLGSLLALVVLVAAVFAYGSRRPVGTPVTWGEAIVGAAVVFWIFFLAYGIVPHSFLSWADGKTLNWRSDSRGIPLGPFGSLLPSKTNNSFLSAERNVMFPDGITFGGRGRVIVSKQSIRDIVAATIYIVFLGANMKLWKLWQNRGKKAAAKAAIEPVSAYGRPLVKKA
jgi:hypothetical protein